MSHQIFMSTQQKNRPTTQQQQIWQRQLQCGRVFTARCQVALAGPVQPSMLLNAVLQVASRHEIFRTFFHDSHEGLVLRIDDEFPGIDAWRQDWTGCSAEEQRQKMQAAWLAESETVAEHDHGPRLRAGLIRLDDQCYELLLTTPSLCADAESLMQFASEVRERYANLQFQEEPGGVAQYSHYAEWQHQLAAPWAKRGIEYWQRMQKRHENAAGRSAWQLNESGPGRLHSMPVEIDQSAIRQLRALATAEGVSLECVLLACWQVLLWRLNDQKPVNVWMWSSGRASTELQRIQGILGRYLPVAAELHGRTELRAVVEEIRELQRAAMTWSEQLSSGMDEFATRFSYQELPSALAGDFITFRVQRAEVEIEPLCLELKCVTITEGEHVELQTELRYNAQRCDAGTVQRISSRWRQLLNSAMCWKTPIEQLRIADAAEIRQILHGFNSSVGETSRVCLHELFEEQIRRSPQADAVAMRDLRLSYETLNQKANQLAHYLKRKGAGPEVVVAVALERSPEMVQAVLGVLKSGGAYLPLDPTYPTERLRYMLDDSGATMIIAQTDLLERLSDSAGKVEWICPEPESFLIEQESVEKPNVRVHPTNLAYLIYTSGSTGKPKATMIPHSGVVNYVEWALAYYGDTRGSLLHSPLAFDLTVTSLFVPLLCGKCVELVRTEEGTEIRELAKALSKPSEPLLLKITPAHANLLGQTSKPEELASRVEVMVVGGEALHARDVAWCSARWPAVRIINEYGPTETVVGCCIYEMNSPEDQGKTVPIGRPIRNTRIYVLDGDLRPAPIGTQGEIYIGGAGVGRGYCRRPELTAERFLPDPYATAGQRMYRTGDLGRWQNSGILEYMGRNDLQVKLAGHRIELGEIEAVLRQLNVRDAAVVKYGGAGNECLVAYLSLRQKQSLEKKAVQSHLAARLPRYMVPELIVFLPQMPYTANGKLNRRALPDPFEEAAGRPFTPPCTELEKLLAGIWSEVLEQPQVGIEDGFFDLGGHSMSAVRIVARIQSALQIELTAQQLFEAGTIARLAQIVEQELRKGSGISVSVPERVDRSIALPLSYAQSRLWFFDQLSPGNVTFNLVQALQIGGDLDVAVLERTCNEIVRRHEILRTAFPSVRGEARQEIAPHRPLKLTVLDLTLRANPRAEAERLIRREEQTPFNLARGPLLRISVYRLAAEENIVVFAAHHIIFDGWSTGVFFREFGALYPAFLAGLPSPLAELQIQYADFAYWERATIQGERLQKHLDFWRRELHEPLPELELPLDRARPAVQTFRGAKHDFALSRQMTEALHKLGRANGATLFMMLLGGFHCMLYGYTGQSDIVVGTDVANRNSAATEALIGFFINQVPIRIHLDGNREFSEVLAQVREKTLSTYPHQEMPFDRLVDGLRIKRKVSSAPVFQVKLVLENIPDATIQLPGLTVTPLEFTHVAAKLDITVLLRETADGIGGWFEYNSDLFDPATVAGMAETFQALLETIVKEPSVQLDVLVRKAGRFRSAAESSRQAAGLS
jgi:amino acid adenylation domain-containing protein